VSQKPRAVQKRSPRLTSPAAFVSANPSRDWHAEPRHLETLFERRKSRASAPRLEMRKQDGVVIVDNDHADRRLGQALLANALGPVDDDFGNGLIGHLLNAGTQGKDIDGRGPNFMLSVIKGVAPRDELEAILAAQMARFIWPCCRS
jgi:hypothetical protein